MQYMHKTQLVRSLIMYGIYPQVMLLYMYRSIYYPKEQCIYILHICSNATMQFPNAILPKLHSACAETAAIS
jgi:hypothetical protein